MPLLDQPELPRWATVPAVDVRSAQPNVVEPPSAKKDIGWRYKEKPPRNWLNWLLRQGYLSDEWVFEQVETLALDWLPNAFRTNPVVNQPGGLNVSVNAVEVWLNGRAFEQPASGTIAVPDSSTNYLYLDSDEIYKLTTVPGTAFAKQRLPVAKIVTSGGTITLLQLVSRVGSARAGHVVTVGTGDVDFTDLQAAIDHAAATAQQDPQPRVEVVISGEVIVPATVNVPFTIGLRGAGPAPTIQWSFTDGALLHFNGALASFSKLRGVTFEYTGSAVTGGSHTAVLATSATDLRVNECNFINCNRGILTASSAARGRLSGCLFQASTQNVTAHVDLSASSGWVVSENHFRGPSGTGSTRAIRGVGAALVQVFGNQIEGYNRHVDIDSASAHAVVVGNVHDFPRTSAIVTLAPDGIFTNNTIRNGGIDAGADDAQVQIGASAARCIVGDNVVVDWKGGWAIRLAGAQSAARDNQCEQITGTAASPVISGGISAPIQFAAIQNNTVDLLVGAALGGGKLKAYGILSRTYTDPTVSLPAASGNNQTITGNRVRNVGAPGGGGGGIGIGFGARSIVGQNYIRNVAGQCLRGTGEDANVHGNEMVEYDNSFLAAPFGLVSGMFSFGPSAQRCTFTDNVAIIPASVDAGPGVFEAGCVECRVFNNQLRVGTNFAAAPLPTNLGRQRFGRVPVSGQTVSGVTVDLTPIISPLGFNDSFGVRAFVRAEEAASTDVSSFEMMGAITTNASGLVTVGTFSTIHIVDGIGGADPTVVLAIDGSSRLVIRATGAPSKTFNWRGWIELDHHASNRFYS